MHQDHWVRDEVAQRTGGMCQEAWRAQGGKRVETVELVMRGRRLQVPTAGKSKHKPKQDTPQRMARRKQNEKAKEAARKRLAAMFPDAYDMLLAEERAARGLEPWPVDIAVRGGAPDEDMAFAKMFAELDKAGVDL